MCKEHSNSWLKYWTFASPEKKFATIVYFKWNMKTLPKQHIRDGRVGIFPLSK